MPVCACSSESAAYWEPFQPPRPAAVYTRQHLLIAIACTHNRLPFVMASRAWRQGVKTFVLLDEPLDPKRAPAGLMEGIAAHNEIYDHFTQPNYQPGTWSQPGDARYKCMWYACELLVPLPPTDAAPQQEGQGGLVSMHLQHQRRNVCRSQKELLLLARAKLKKLVRFLTLVVNAKLWMHQRVMRREEVPMSIWQ